MTLTTQELPPTAAAAAVPSLEDQFVARLRQVFTRLDEAEIPFCILRNRERIPSSLLTGSDVDLLVPAGTTVKQLLAIVADLQPAHVVPHHATLEVYFRVGKLFMHVDFLIADRQWRGAVYLKNTDILAESRDDAGMPVASNLHQAFCAWFSSLTRRRMYKDRYSPLIAAAARNQPEEMRTLLDQTFGDELGGELMNLAKNDGLADCNALAKPCRRRIWRQAFLSHPFKTLWELFGYYRREVALYFRPTGLVVAILGPDGAGKSTVCSIVAESSRAVLPFSSIETQHMYERALPRLSELKKGRVRRKPLTPAVTHDPHGKKPHGLLSSMLSLFYTAVDQRLSRLCWGRRKLAKNMLLLHDRHMMEIVVDPKRFRYGGPQALAQSYVSTIPLPDVTILLDASAHVLHARKQEVPIEETNRQRYAYRALVNDMPGGRIISCDRPPEEVAEDVKRIITEELAARTARRFGIGTDRKRGDE